MANHTRMRTRAVELVAGGHQPDAMDDLATIVRGLVPLLYAFRIDHGEGADRFTVIKIGYSTKLNERRAHLGVPWTSLLAIKPATFRDEQAIHRQYAADRAYAREYYRPTPRIIALVDEWRAAYNLPPLIVAA